VGALVGEEVGAPVGEEVGEEVGLIVGTPVGDADGLSVGEPVGEELFVGFSLGVALGKKLPLGLALGSPQSTSCIVHGIVTLNAMASSAGSHCLQASRSSAEVVASYIITFTVADGMSPKQITVCSTVVPPAGTLSSMMQTSPPFSSSKPVEMIEPSPFTSLTMKLTVPSLLTEVTVIKSDPVRVIPSVPSEPVISAVGGM
jgi:hypothetical protein